jgi:two-component system response regulator YesN
MEGISFSAYLKKVRIEKAKQLLLTTNMKVFEVSNAVGFSHAKYFGHVFKEVVGQTPASYQKYEKTDA